MMVDIFVLWEMFCWSSFYHVATRQILHGPEAVRANSVGLWPTGQAVNRAPKGVGVCMLGSIRHIFLIVIWHALVWCDIDMMAVIYSNWMWQQWSDICRVWTFFGMSIWTARGTQFWFMSHGELVASFLTILFKTTFATTVVTMMIQW